MSLPRICRRLVTGPEVLVSGPLRNQGQRHGEERDESVERNAQEHRVGFANRADRYETGQEHARDGPEGVQGIEGADVAGEVPVPAAAEGAQGREGGTHQGGR